MKKITFPKSNFLRQRKVMLLLAVCSTAYSVSAATEISTVGTYSYFQATVKGTVVSGTDQMPVPGVTVMIKGTTDAVVTDIDGNYEIQTAGPDAILVFSGVGLKTVEVQIGSQTSINVTMLDETQSIDEVVVVGYGTKKKATVTGSISEIGGKDLIKSPSPNVSNSFAGRVSGVIASNRAGEPGYDDSSISIRGLATTGNNDVLVVVDGVPGQIGGLSRLNPQEIESITVLKDASAAIYGSRAANGVILVTTKKGKKGAKLSVNYTFDQGFSSPTRLPDMAD
ncbi:MAG: TonB-dependent receptor plug domain-containing protein, partial [Bacteroidota bacterium]